MIQTTEKPKAAVPPFRMELKSKPPPTAKGLDSLSAATRRVYDVFQRLAPDGSHPVRRAEVADELGISYPAVSQHVTKMRAAGVFLAGWGASYGPKQELTAAPAIEPPPPDSPAARSLVSHATKHRVTADERRAREADAERDSYDPDVVWKRVNQGTAWARDLYEHREAIGRVLAQLPADPARARRILTEILRAIPEADA